MSFSNTLQRVVNASSIYTRLNPLSGVGAISNEPAFSIGDYVRQTILSPPFAWRWNRKVTRFLAVIGVQDYIISSWVASTTYPGPTGTESGQGVILVDSNYNQQRVIVSGTSGATVPSWNTTTGGTTTDNSVTWVNDGPVGRPVSPLLSFGWLEKASATDTNASTHELTVRENLAEESQQNQLFLISPFLEPSQGSPGASPFIGFRLMPAPEQNYTVSLIYQQSATNFASLSDTWSPIPDYLYYLYFQGFLAKTYEYLADERTALATQTFVRYLMAANQGLTDAQRNLYLLDRLIMQREATDFVRRGQLGDQGRMLL